MAYFPQPIKHKQTELTDFVVLKCKLDLLLIASLTENQ